MTGTTVVVDSHVLFWIASDPGQLSAKAAAAVDGASEVAVAAITWYELSWLARHGRIELDVPSRSWLDALASAVRTLPITPAIAATAVDLPATFPGDPADRLIFATAVEHGVPLVSKDRRLRSARHPGARVIW